MATKRRRHYIFGISYRVQATGSRKKQQITNDDNTPTYQMESKADALGWMNPLGKSSNVGSNLVLMLLREYFNDYTKTK
jgi:hypothetical protein